MLLYGGETYNDETHSNSFASQRGKLDGHHESDHIKNNCGRNPWNLEGRALSALNRFGEKARMVSDPMWFSRVQHQQAIIEPNGNRF